MTANSRDYAKAHYEANKAAYVARAKAHTDKQRQRLIRLMRAMKTRPCMDCGGIFPPYVMDFDHVRDVKVKDVATLASAGVSLKTFLAETAKCEIVCANCHRERTHQRKQV